MMLQNLAHHTALLYSSAEERATNLRSAQDRLGQLAEMEENAELYICKKRRHAWGSACSANFYFCAGLQQLTLTGKKVSCRPK